MEESDIPADLTRLAGNTVIGLGVVPEYDVMMIFFTSELTLYIKLENGELKLDMDAPCLQ